MNACLNHTYKALLTIMAMEDEADAKAGRAEGSTTQAREMCAGGDAGSHLECATSPAVAGRFRGRFDGVANPPRPCSS